MNIQKENCDAKNNTHGRSRWSFDRIMWGCLIFVTIRTLCGFFLK